MQPGRALLCVCARHQRRPSIATSCADQTCLALFLSLRLGTETPQLRCDIALHCWNAHPMQACGRTVNAANTFFAFTRRRGSKNMGRPHCHPKPDVVVTVVGVIPVAVGAARVVIVVGPRAAAQNLTRPPDDVSLLAISHRMHMIAKIKNRVFPLGEVSPRPPPESEFPETQRPDFSERRVEETGADRTTTRKPRW